jgi:hypothetical protein
MIDSKFEDKHSICPNCQRYCEWKGTMFHFHAMKLVNDLSKFEKGTATIFKIDWENDCFADLIESRNWWDSLNLTISSPLNTYLRTAMKRFWMNSGQLFRPLRLRRWSIESAVVDHWMESNTLETHFRITESTPNGLQYWQFLSFPSLYQS